MRERTAYWFILIVLLLILFLLGATWNVQSQAGDGVQFSFTCRSATVTRFTVTMPSNVLYVLVNAAHYPALPTQWLRWIDSGPKPASVSSEVPRATGHLIVASQIGERDFHYNVEIPRGLRDCGEALQNPISPAGRECLGVPYPSEGIFTVDGNDYYYREALSFVVPLDALWTWRLYIQGQLILVFKQDAPGNCRITEDYRP